MAKNTDVDKELIKEKLEYIGLDLNKVPKFLKEYEPLNFRPVRAYNQTTTYRVYKHINVQDIEILPSKIAGTITVCPTENYEGFFIAKIKKLR